VHCNSSFITTVRQEINEIKNYIHIVEVLTAKIYSTDSSVTERNIFKLFTLYESGPRYPMEPDPIEIQIPKFCFRACGALSLKSMFVLIHRGQWTMQNIKELYHDQARSVEECPVQRGGASAIICLNHAKF
jgi:hypothetical protein